MGEPRSRKWELAPNGFRVIWRELDTVREIVDCGVVCDTATNAQSRTEFNRANARLIAAAPELLAALEAICAQAESWHTTHGHEPSSVQCDAICELIPKMRAAIRKAKGDKSDAH